MHLPPQTIYPDLERGDVRFSGLVIDEARAWCQGGAALWTPPRPSRNPAEIMAVLGALWLADQIGAEVRWDGASLRGATDPLATMTQRRTAPAGLGGIHLGDIQIGLRRGRAALWAGQVTAHKIWTANVALISAGWDTTSVEATITGYDPSTYLRSGDLGWSTNEQKFSVPARPAVELMALIGAEAMIRANFALWRGRKVALPVIAALPLRDWRDARRLLRWARFDDDWPVINSFLAAADGQRPSLCAAPMISTGRYGRLGWIGGASH